MSTNSSALFPQLFGTAPRLVRGFLNSALQFRELQSLYAEARQRYPDLELSEKLLKMLRVEIEITQQDLLRFPQSGPFVVVTNHPFGILDGMLLDAVLLRARPDTKILTNSVLCGIEELSTRCLPIDVFGGEAALENNVKCLREVLSLLRKGHGIAFFPAGGVSHWRNELRRIADPPWSRVAARCAMLANVPILPLYFTGENSLSFQVAGLIHPRLRTARLPGELLNKRNRRIEVRVGGLIKPSELRRFGSVEKATDYLRARTYMLRHRKAAARTSTSDRLKQIRFFSDGTPGDSTDAASRILYEIERLEFEGKTALQNHEYAVYLENGNRIPELVQEIGRLREITFRAAGEGTGRMRDLDNFDSYYQHLVLWHKTSQQVIGSYRLAWTSDVLPTLGIQGLYTSTLFRFQPEFFSRIGPGLELGRSFIRSEFQKEYAPLLLLWQAIAQTAAKRPEAPVLFGAVSISNEYSEASRELIVQYVARHGFRNDLAPLAVPRRPFRSRLSKGFEFNTVSQCLQDLDGLSGPISDIGDGSGVPVLLRQYFKLGGKVAGFNVDRAFSNALDGLLIVDLRDTDSRILDRYMGATLGSEFRARMRRPSSA